MIVEDDYIEEMMQRREGQEPSGLNKYSKRPRLKINKLSDDRRSVPLQLDIEINDKLVIRERFDWPLDYPNISPAMFSERLCAELSLPEANVENIKKQIITQIIDHIERNTNPLQKAKTKTETTFEAEVEVPAFDFFGGDKKEDEEQGGTRQTERQRTIEEMRKKGSTVGKFTADGKKECRYCNTVQIVVSEYCKNCKLPFKLSDNVNMEIERESLPLKFLEELIKNIDIVAEAELEKILTADDLKSLYYFRNVLIYKLLELPEVKEDGISKELVNAVNTIYKEVLSTVDGLDKELEVESKSDEADEKESQSMHEDEDSPSKLVQKVIRKRGRPPKKNPLPKKFTLRKAK